MGIVKVEGTTKKPDIAVLDKAFEILAKAGFPQDDLDEAYKDLKEVCDGTESDAEDAAEGENMDVQKKGVMSKPDMPANMMSAMQAFMDKLSQK